MKFTLTLPSGAIVAATLSDLEAMFPGKVVQQPSVNGVALAIGATIPIDGGFSLAVTSAEQ